MNIISSVSFWNKMKSKVAADLRVDSAHSGGIRGLSSADIREVKLGYVAHKALRKAQSKGYVRYSLYG